MILEVAKQMEEMRTSEMLRKLLEKSLNLDNLLRNVAMKIKNATKNNGFIYSEDYENERDKLDLDIMNKLGLTEVYDEDCEGIVYCLGYMSGEIYKSLEEDGFYEELA